jgi:PAS domain S-box-containing protein
LEALTERAASAIETVQLYEQSIKHGEELDLHVMARTLALETQRAHLNSILEAMIECVSYWEGHASGPQIQWVNHAFTTLTGYEEAQIIHDSHFVTKLAAARDKLAAQAMYKELDTEKLVQREIAIERKDGTIFIAALTLKLMSDPTETPQRGMALLRDISHERALQEQKDRFIANASHELRTPLSNFKLRLYLIRKQPDHLEQHLSVLEQVADRMHWLVEDLLDISRFERGTIELNRTEFELQQVVSDVITL